VPLDHCFIEVVAEGVGLGCPRRPLLASVAAPSPRNVLRYVTTVTSGDLVVAAGLSR